MIFLRRDRAAPQRWTALRVALFFLAAGIWIAGVMVEDDRFTTLALVIAAIGLLVGLHLRRVDRVREDAATELDEPVD